MKTFLLWLRYFKTLLRLSWQARSEPANRAKVRRIIRAAEKEISVGNLQRWE